jgi:hypothetical protein
MQYTIKAVMPSGKVDPKFGQEFYVQFEEMNDSPALWFKSAPETGSQLDLEQVNGRWKKVKKEWNQSHGAPTGQAAPTAAKAPYKDNSDGMRQGMCINNAANYVNTLQFEKALTDREWASLIHSYAQALYQLGDLKSEADVPENVADVFGPGTTSFSER